jgi:hypothetical protein
MKKELLGLILTFMLLVACDDNDDDSKKGTNTKITEVENAVVGGKWRITYFFDTDTEETDNFRNYIFEFDSSNILTATNGSNNYPGTWSVTDDDSSHDDSNNDFKDIDFNIAFTNPPDFEELSEDWEIISLSSMTIELRHISGGNGGTDLLTLEKI